MNRQKIFMLVKEVMNENVITAPPEMNIVEAAKKMTESNIGSLVIVKDEKLAGLITDRDILTKVVAKGRDIMKTALGDIMSKEVIYVKPDLDIEDAAEIMTEHSVKKLPVIDNDTLLGIITATDIIAAHPKIMEKIESLVILAKKEKPIAG